MSNFFLRKLASMASTRTKPAVSKIGPRRLTHDRFARSMTTPKTHPIAIAKTRLMMLSRRYS